jgi:hypothetical protein
MVQLKIKKISMQGFNIAAAGHVAILPPKSISGGSGLINPAFSMKNYKHATILIASGAFSSMGGYIGANYELSGSVSPIEVNAARVTAGVFPTVGVNPILGRVFTEQEEESHQPVALISYALWAERYHRDRSVVGTSIQLDRKLYTILGVMPRSFTVPLETGPLDQTQLWVPMSLTARYARRIRKSNKGWDGPRRWQPGPPAQIAPQPSHHFQALLEETQRHLAAQPQILRLVHHSHSATTQHLQHAIMGDFLAGHTCAGKGLRLGASFCLRYLPHLHRKSIAAFGDGFDVLPSVGRLAQYVSQ